MANAEYGSAGGVGRHHEPAYRLLSPGAVLMRYCAEGLPPS
jgi:hypothetical protein